MENFGYTQNTNDAPHHGTAMPTLRGGGTCKTLADLLASVKVSTEHSESEKRTICQRVERCVSIIGFNLSMSHAPASAFSCDVAWLNGVLFQRLPKAHGINRPTFNTYIAGLREALRHAGLLPRAVKIVVPADGPWLSLLCSISEDMERTGLPFMAQWCHARGLMPSDVTSATFKALEKDMTSHRLDGRIRDKVGSFATLFRRLIRNGAVEASDRIVAPNRRQPYTKPFTDYPESFQRDVQAFQDLLSTSSNERPYTVVAPPKPLSPATVKSRLFSVRQAAAALVLMGRDPSTITSLTDLVELDAFRAILTYFWKRAIQLKIDRGDLAAGERHPNEEGVTQQTSSIATSLILVAKLHLRLDAAALADLRAWGKGSRPPQQTEISPKMRKLLHTLSVPATRLALLRLPQTLMHRAESLLKDNRPAEAGRVAMIATAIKIELLLPLRLGNLTTLRLDTELLRFDPRRPNISLLNIAAGKVKNRKLIEWPVDLATARFIDRYVSTFRPLLFPGSEIWLFPSAHGNRDTARSIDSISDGITDAIAEHVGVKMHVHAFRGFMAMLVLEENPEAREDLRQLLGHKTMHTSDCYYAFMNPAHAARRVAATIERATKGASLWRAAKPPATVDRRAGKPRYSR